MRIFLYLATIVLANIVTAAFKPLAIGPFLIPYGTWLIGATFILRDLVQNRYGRRVAYIAIISALILSAISSKLLGDTLAITFASAVSFLISESCDTEIYTRFNMSMLKRVFTSGTISGMLDSAIFVTIGLSPLISNIIPWQFIPMAILGQFMVKTFMQTVGVCVLYAIIKNREVHVA